MDEKRLAEIKNVAAYLAVLEVPTVVDTQTLAKMTLEVIVEVHRLRLRSDTFRPDWWSRD